MDQSRRLQLAEIIDEMIDEKVTEAVATYDNHWIRIITQQQEIADALKELANDCERALHNMQESRTTESWLSRVWARFRRH